MFPDMTYCSNSRAKNDQCYSLWTVQSSAVNTGHQGYVYENVY